MISYTGEDLEQGELSSMTTGNANLHGHYGNKCGSSSERWGFDLSQDIAIPLLDIYPKDVSSYHMDTCSTMLVIALFVTASNRN